MDPGSGGSGRVGSEVASDCRSLRHSLQLQTPGLFLSPLRSHDSRHRRISSGVGWPPAYAFPPFALIRQVINKLVSSKGTFLTLITPFWPQKEWFPELLSLAVASLVPLPIHRDLLRQPHFHCLHQNLPVINLHAVRAPLRAVSTCG